MRQLSLLLWAWIHTTRNLASGRLWGPFLIYACLQALGLLLLTQFHQPILAPVLMPLLRAAAGEGALHYPVFYLSLPAVFSRLTLLLDLVFGAWLFGAAFLFFWQADRPTEPAGSGLRTAAASWGKLLLARLPIAVGLAVLVVWIPSLLWSAEAPTGWTLRAVRYGTIAVGSFLEALLFYAPLLILVEGRGVGAALRGSMLLFRRIPIATLGAVLIPNLIQIPISHILFRSERIVTRLSPEVVAWVILGSVIVYSLATFYIVGVGARLFRVQTEAVEV
jgi:hypothetical protein